MAVLLDFYRCPLCGKFHDFCWRGGYILAPGAAYSFACPVTGVVGVLRDVHAPGSPVDRCPASAVELRAAPAPPAAGLE